MVGHVTAAWRATGGRQLVPRGLYWEEMFTVARELRFKSEVVNGSGEWCGGETSDVGLPE